MREVLLYPPPVLTLVFSCIPPFHFGALFSEELQRNFHVCLLSRFPSLSASSDTPYKLTLGATALP